MKTGKVHAMRRIWLYPPEWHWYGWRTFLPYFFGTDEYRRRTVMLGWTITGRIVIVYGRQAVLRLTDSPKMVREALCRVQAVIELYSDSRVRRDIEIVNRLIDECDRNRPLGPDGTHGDRHTPTCGCEDK